MVAKFNYLRRGQCPICNGQDKGPCRENIENNFIHCRAGLSAPLGWREIGQDSLGFYMYGPESENDWDRSQRWDYQDKRNNEPSELTASHRDLEIKKVLNLLKLDDDHREKLKRDRFLTDDQIEAIGFRSVNPQYITTFSNGYDYYAVNLYCTDGYIDNRLPGIGYKGNTLSASGKGILCPIRDINGNLISWQIRLDESDNGKYKWAKNPYLSTGEMPISFFPGDNDTLYICEGTSFKPLITNIKTNSPTVGAAGGNFKNSKNQLEEIINRVQPKEIRIPVDAEYIIINAKKQVAEKSNVKAGLKNLISFIGQKYPNIPIKIGYWEQLLDKSKLDIDELSQEEIDQIHWISPKEFWFKVNKAKRELGKQVEPTQTKTKLKWIEPDDSAYQEYVKRQYEEARVNGFQIAEKRIKKLLETIKSALKPQKEETTNNDTFKQKDVDVWFNKGERIKAYHQAFNEGYRVFLDRSRTGTGKDYDNARRYPDPEIKVKDGDNVKVIQPKLWTLDQEHNNKDSDWIKWDNLDPRHNGMYADDTRQTDMGKHYVTTQKKYETQSPIIPSNCERAELFAETRSKGIPNLEVGGEINPICATCSKFEKCRKPGEGVTGGSYLGDRHLKLKESRLLAHPNSLPSTMDYQNDSFIVNEAGNLLNAKKIIEVGRKDWANAMDFARTNPDLSQGEKDLLDELSDLYHLEILPDTNRNGLNHEQLINSIIEILNVPKQTLEELGNKFNTYWQGEYSKLLAKLKDKDTVTKQETKELTTKQLKWVRSEYKKRQTASILQQIKDFPKYFLGDLFLIASGKLGGDVTSRYGKLTVTTRDERFREILKQGKTITLLDATLTKERAARLLDIDPSLICVGAQADVTTDNLEIIRVELESDGSNDLSDDYLTRLGNLIQWFKTYHKEGISIVPKKYMETLKGDMAYMSQTRGSNRAIGRDLIIKPVLPDVGALKTDFNLEYPEGTQEQFDEYYKQRQLDELEQTIGRTRWHRTPNKKITVLLALPATLTAADIKERGLPIVDKPIQDICLEAAPKHLADPIKLIKFAYQAVRKGKKITQEWLAAKFGRHQSNISRLLKKHGVNLNQLTELCKSLYIAIKGKRIKINHHQMAEEITPEIEAIVEQFNIDPSTLVAQILKDWIDKGFAALQPLWLDWMPVDLLERILDLLLCGWVRMQVDPPPESCPL